MGVLGSEEMDGLDVLALLCFAVLCFHERGGFVGYLCSLEALVGYLVVGVGEALFGGMEGGRGREARVCFLGWRGSRRKLGERGGEGREGGVWVTEGKQERKTEGRKDGSDYGDESWKNKECVAMEWAGKLLVAQSSFRTPSACSGHFRASNHKAT